MGYEGLLVAEREIKLTIGDKSALYWTANRWFLRFRTPKSN